MSKSKIQISAELAEYNTDGEDPNGDSYAIAGPVAAHIARLEARIEELEMVATDQRFEGLSKRLGELEARPVPGARIQAGSASIDTRSLTVQDVADLIRASK